MAEGKIKTLPPEARRGPAYAVASLCGAGRFPFLPGTLASLLAAGAWLGILRFVPSSHRDWVMLVLPAGMTILALWAAQTVLRGTPDADPSEIVIDEVAGMFVALAGLPGGIRVAAGAFLLFRVFDILKPPPVRQVERCGGGAGVVADDLLAGLLANLVWRAGHWAWVALWHSRP